jgi:hypothetical protein
VFHVPILHFTDGCKGCLHLDEAVGQLNKGPAGLQIPEETCCSAVS